MLKPSVQEPNLVQFLRFCLYLTAFVPLVIFKDFISPFHFGKVLVFRSLVEIMGVAYLIFVFIILTSVFTKKEHWQKLFNLTIFAGVLSAFYGFGQKMNIGFILGSGGRERIFGTIGNPALFR